MPTKAKLNNTIRYAVKGLTKDSSKQLSVLIRDYFYGVESNELVNRNTRSLACIATSHLELARSWTKRYRAIRCRHLLRSL